jgi:integrase/recombinase XerD
VLNLRDLQNAVSGFYDFLSNEKKLKLNSLNSYKRDVEAFCEYVKNINKSDITPEKMCGYFSSYMTRLKKAGRSPATLSRNIASLRGFFKFLYSRKLISADPTQNYRYEKKSGGSEYGDLLTADEVDAVISATKTEDIKGYRDCAIVETLYACGLKVSELINIKISDLHLDNGYITISSDGETRYTPVYKGAKIAINAYLKKSRKYLITDKKNGFLFLNRNGGPLTRQGLWKLLKSYGEKANIGKELTPHLFRRSMAVHLAESGVNLDVIKDLLGHKHISLTQDYVKNFKPKIVSIYERVHPKA